MSVYNFFLSVVNVYCFLGFLWCLIRADSLYLKKEDPQLSRVYYVYWATKVGLQMHIWLIIVTQNNDTIMIFSIRAR